VRGGKDEVEDKAENEAGVATGESRGVRTRSRMPSASKKKARMSSRRRRGRQKVGSDRRSLEAGVAARS